ncbi:MAG: alpha/beta hydrolase [Pedobacter sp.]|nr:alpha/beta hydrolase [Pedobacter sp.]
MSLIQLDAGVLHVDEQGSGEPLLLLHANPGDPRDFDAVLPALSERYRVLRLSWPAYGFSPAPESPAAASAMQFATLLEQLVLKLDLSGLRIIGNSVGAYAAVRLALSQPQRVRSLVLVSPGGFTAHNFFTRDFCRFKGREYVTRALNGILAWRYLRHKTPVTLAMRERARREQKSPAAVAVNAALWRSFIDPDHDLRAVAADITAATLVLGGRYDPLIPAAESRHAAALIPGAHCVILPCGHAPFAEIPDIFLAMVLPFLE